MQFWIDVGGTFTDCFVAYDDGRTERAKVLSSGRIKGRPDEQSHPSLIVDLLRQEPDDFWRGYQVSLFDESGHAVASSSIARSTANELALEAPLPCRPTPQHAYELSSGEEAPIVAMRLMLGLPLNEPLPPATVKLGTTRGTNALLTRGGARTGFMTTAGFEDILRIGNQNRDDLFALDVVKPVPLFEWAAGVGGRIGADGQVLEELDQDAALRQFEEWRSHGIDSLAICLLHACANPSHELQLEQLARPLGFTNISLSHATASLMKLVSRGDTTTVDAYLNPVLQEYVTRVQSRLNPQSELRLLTSAGGLARADQFRGKDSVLSGPAGGVVGFSQAALAAGFSQALGFDMGGTSTDVARFAGEFERQFETRKAGVRIVAPMMAIETVAAGGGSICQFDGVKFTVGPESAGADPGPACYGNGGPLTVTDINVFLGRVLPDRFPFRLDKAAVSRRLREVQDHLDDNATWPLERIAEGFLRVANANMVRAIRSISVARGYDPVEHVLTPFGGAAGQHACAIARELRIRTALVHPDAGVLSALGAGLADITRHASHGVYADWASLSGEDRESIFAAVEQDALQRAVSEGADESRVVLRRSADLRYRGVDAALTVSQPDDGDFSAAFDAEHLRRFGYLHADRPLEWVAARVEAIGKSNNQLPATTPTDSERRVTETTTRAFFDGAFVTASVFDGGELSAGDYLVGPAIIVEKLSTTVVEPDWTAEVLSEGELLLTDTQQPSGQLNRTSDSDPVSLEIYNNLFASIAEQMGITLQHTSSSVNVKERLDYSCAIFTATGDLVVNAPHMPVHLGAMSETVKCVLQDFPTLQPGDVVITNDPYRGGSHLPDITVVTPVFAGSNLMFFTASRAHHAEVGGTAPGSMPPMSKNLAEEGVLIRPFKVVAQGVSKLDELECLLREAPLPSRNPADNLADVQAQIAANRRGAQDLLQLADQRGSETVLAYMRHIQEAAERKMRLALSRLTDGRREFTDYMDNGAAISVVIDIQGDAATVDFSNTSQTLSSNLNANRAIVTAAVLYCMRCLIDEDIPLNQGVLAPLNIVLPECLLNPRAHEDPAQCPAVVGGNVETSQRVVDVLLGALELAAASQGTMNNLLFGDESFGYYETICGGTGATPFAPGADAVHSHMTNTRITDPEVLEHRFPVRIREFSIRHGSGGAGAQAGGDGAVRRLEFLKPLTVTLLTQRRGAYAPFGLGGGEDGAIGRNTVIHADGTSETVAGCARLDVEAGDQLQIETPGGGGFGPPDTTP